MTTTPEQIEQYFDQLDWPFIRKEERLWDSGYSGENFRFRFFVRLTEKWLYVTWLFPITILPDCRENMYDHVLRLSYHMNGAKVMLDNDDDLIVTVELPCENMSVDGFEAALRGVCWNVDQHFLELVKIARESDAVSSLSSDDDDDDDDDDETPPAPPTAPDGPDQDIDWGG